MFWELQIVINHFAAAPVKVADKITPRSVARNVRKSKLTDLEVEILILEAQQRTPLWDFLLPLEQRSRETVRRLWEEVSTGLSSIIIYTSLNMVVFCKWFERRELYFIFIGKLNAADAQKKFKNLRDTYRKLIQAEQHASGSARIDVKDKWKHYDVMEFLRDSCLIRP